MVKKKSLLALTLLGSLAFLFTYFFYRYAIDIEGTVKSGPDEMAADTSSFGKPAAYISVISRYPPNIIFSGYQPMLDYLTSQSEFRFELKLCDDYSQAVRMLINKEVVAAFLGSYVYIQAHDEFGVLPVLKPLNSNFEPFSRSVLFTAASKNIYSLNDLKNKKLALPSKESYSSNWILRYEFAKHSLLPGDLAEIINLPYHQSVIQNVINGEYDAGVTREYLIQKIINRSIRIVLYSDPFPTSPIVVVPDYSKPAVDALKRALLKINRQNPERENITRGWDNEFIYGFVEASDTDYDIVRKISK